jgi:hypothetical protein
MHENKNYLVRVRKFSDADHPFGWELCQGAGSLVLQRSTRTFATRAEALIDSAQIAAALALPIDVTLPSTDDAQIGPERPFGAQSHEAEI